ncbi:MAG: bifunctional diaminohydroxyphosphoribosylaminopyrimidine deaminase/5-amino-6-(5-phosphoribosylamino)uracil reductase RibD [Dehalococcoidia bacterium]|nr:bifunctional diaminohydroxyphosphoribosylaminopyrimidine deaminase/5-amino-6-(5-phosphoribosylamino)uracil reductase RibD [Dehalococcoidia bacterium]
MTTDHMQLALVQAKKALGNVSPNPAVGAVIVKEGKVVGEGYTQPPGSAHAEIMALSQAGEASRGATLYVTLEPCCHFGRTPPCTEAIVASGIREVHMAMLDPNPLVSGKGKAQLEGSGIKTYLGDREEEAKEINEAYARHITTGMPFVTAKFAMSLDGKIATRTFDSRWISNEQSREYVHQVRWKTDAIMVGVNTVLRDDPQLTARIGGKVRQPLRVIIDSHGRTPLSAKVLQSPDKVLIAATPAIEREQLKQYSDLGVSVLTLPSKDDRVDIDGLLRHLGRQGITSVLVEGGGTLMGSLFDLERVDKVLAFISPMIIGGSQAIPPVAGQGVNSVAEALRLKRIRVERFGDDIMVSGYMR